MKHKVILTLDIEVLSFSGKATPLPDIQTVMAAWVDYCGHELLSHKELAESCGVPAMVTATITDWEPTAFAVLPLTEAGSRTADELLRAGWRVDQCGEHGMVLVP